MTPDLAALVERLDRYNPPDRTIDEQRQIAQDIADAKVAIESLAAENARLHAELTASDDRGGRLAGYLDDETERAERAEDSGQVLANKLCVAEAECFALRKDAEQYQRLREMVSEWAPHILGKFDHTALAANPAAPPSP